MVNLLPLGAGEHIRAILPIREYNDDLTVFMATSNGTVKKTSLQQFSRPRANGIIAIDLREGNDLIDVALTTGDSEVMLFANSGKAIRFNEGDVRTMGRTAAGVKGITLDEGESVNALIILGEGKLLMATENGFGKRTDIEQFSAQKRGGRGVISIKTSPRNGQSIGAVQVMDDDEIMLITNGGTLVRTSVDQVSETSRNTQGVTLIRLDKGESLAELEKIINLPGSEEGEDSATDDIVEE